MKNKEEKKNTALTVDPPADPPGPAHAGKIIALVLAVMLLAGAGYGISKAAGGVRNGSAASDNSISSGEDSPEYTFDTGEPVLGCVQITQYMAVYDTAESDPEHETGLYVQRHASYNVYETSEKDGHIWYRIGRDLWINDTGAVCHMGEDASAYPPERDMAGTYYGENVILRLSYDGTCVIKDRTGRYAESSGTFRFELSEGNVEITADGDSPLMYYIRQNGLEEGPAVMDVFDEDILMLTQGTLYEAQTGEQFILSENEGISDPDELISVYFEAAMNKDDELMLSLFADVWIEENGGKDVFLEAYDPSHDEYIRETGIASWDYDQQDPFDEFAYELNYAFDMNASSASLITYIVHLNDGNDVKFQFCVVEIDGAYYITRIA